MNAAVWRNKKLHTKQISFFLLFSGEYNHDSHHYSSQRSVMKGNCNYSLFKGKKDLCNNRGEKTKRGMGGVGGAALTFLHRPERVDWEPECRRWSRWEVTQLQHASFHYFPFFLLKEGLQTSLQRHHLGTDTKVWLQVYNCIFLSSALPPFALLPAHSPSLLFSRWRLSLISTPPPLPPSWSLISPHPAPDYKWCRPCGEPWGARSLNSGCRQDEWRDSQRPAGQHIVSECAFDLFRPACGPLGIRRKLTSCRSTFGKTVK